MLRLAKHFVYPLIMALTAACGGGGSKSPEQKESELPAANTEQEGTGTAGAWYENENWSLWLGETSYILRHRIGKDGRYLTEKGSINFSGKIKLAPEFYQCRKKGAEVQMSATSFYVMSEKFRVDFLVTCFRKGEMLAPLYLESEHKKRDVARLTREHQDVRDEVERLSLKTEALDTELAKSEESLAEAELTLSEEMAVRGLLEKNRDNETASKILKDLQDRDTRSRKKKLLKSVEKNRLLLEAARASQHSLIVREEALASDLEKTGALLKDLEARIRDSQKDFEAAVEASKLVGDMSSFDPVLRTVEESPRSRDSLNLSGAEGGKKASLQKVTGPRSGGALISCDDFHRQYYSSGSGVGDLLTIHPSTKNSSFTSQN